MRPRARRILFAVLDLVGWVVFAYLLEPWKLLRAPQRSAPVN